MASNGGIEQPRTPEEIRNLHLEGGPKLASYEREMAVEGIDEAGYELAVALEAIEDAVSGGTKAGLSMPEIIRRIEISLREEATFGRSPQLNIQLVIGPASA